MVPVTAEQHLDLYKANGIPYKCYVEGKDTLGKNLRREIKDDEFLRRAKYRAGEGNDSKVFVQNTDTNFVQINTGRVLFRAKRNFID